MQTIPKCYEMTEAEKLASLELADKLLASQKTTPV